MFRMVRCSRYSWQSILRKRRAEDHLTQDGAWIGLVFRADIRGSVIPMGEALDFRSFDVAHLPDDDGIGFGQGQVLRVHGRRSRSRNSWIERPTEICF